jgi:hypothetical protein
MATKALVAKLPEKLYHEFIETVVKGGKWDTEGLFTEAINLAVEEALRLFIKDSKGELSLPEFREYASKKYPNLDEYLVCIIENLLAQEKQSKKEHKSDWR